MSGRGFRNGAGFGHSHGRNCGKRSGRSAVGHGGVHCHTTAFENETEVFTSQESRNREITRLENIANTLSSELEIVKNKINELKDN